MGEVRDQMNPSQAPAEDDAKILETLTNWLKKKKTSSAETFADHVEAASTALPDLIQKKKDELGKEKGRESYNQQALGKLLTMKFHLDSIAELVSQYRRG